MTTPAGVIMGAVFRTSRIQEVDKAARITAAVLLALESQGLVVIRKPPGMIAPSPFEDFDGPVLAVVDNAASGVS